MGQPIYDKPPLPLAEQAGRLIERGLKGATAGELADFLATVSYYRLRGYTYRYQLPDKTFRPGAEWGTIREDYFFDSRLRELLFAAVSHVEIPLRTQIVLHMSLAHGPWWWSDAGLARDAGSWEKSKDKLLAEWRASRELFAKCHRSKYGDDALPPAWKVFETATFGILTRYYGNVMPNDPAAKAVAAFWGLQPVVLFSWLLHLNTVRNLCAHHCRLFSAALPQAPKYPTNRAAPAVLRAGRWPNPNQPYATFAVLALLLKRCRPEYPFGRLAGELLRVAAPRHLQAMGFPPGWQDEPLFAGW